MSNDVLDQSLEGGTIVDGVLTLMLDMPTSASEPRLIVVVSGTETRCPRKAWRNKMRGPPSGNR